MSYSGLEEEQNENDAAIISSLLFLGTKTNHYETKNGTNIDNFRDEEHKGFKEKDVNTTHRLQTRESTRSAEKKVKDQIADSLIPTEQISFPSKVTTTPIKAAPKTADEKGKKKKQHDSVVPQVSEEKIKLITPPKQGTNNYLIALRMCHC